MRKGNERIGAALYDEKLRLALNSPLSRQELRGRAERMIADLRSKMYVESVKIAARPRRRAGAAGQPDAPTSSSA